MAKASLNLPNGTKVNIEGTAEDVALLLSRYSQPSGPTKGRRKKGVKRKKSKGAPSGARKTRKGPTGLITDLADEQFFKTKRMLSDIQKKLEEKGHIYAQTSLSPALVRLVRKKVLRRLREKKGWVYVS